MSRMSPEAKAIYGLIDSDEYLRLVGAPVKSTATESVRQKIREGQYRRWHKQKDRANV